MADGAPQIWDIPVTPAQRWGLAQIAFHQQAPAIADAHAGKALRRALRAFGLIEIRATLLENEGKLSSEYSTSTTPALHKITSENLDCVLSWRAVPRIAAVEVEVGELFDLLEEIKQNPEWSWVGSAAAAAWGDPIRVFVSDAEDWEPPDVGPFEITCPSCKQTFDTSELGAERRG